MVCADDVFMVVPVYVTPIGCAAGYAGEGEGHGEGVRAEEDACVACEGVRAVFRESASGLMGWVAIGLVYSWAERVARRGVLGEVVEASRRLSRRLLFSKSLSDSLEAEERSFRHCCDGRCWTRGVKQCRMSKLMAFNQNFSVLYPRLHCTVMQSLPNSSRVNDAQSRHQLSQLLLQH